MPNRRLVPLVLSGVIPPSQPRPAPPHAERERLSFAANQIAQPAVAIVRH
jgi:hypothetical protein